MKLSFRKKVQEWTRASDHRAFVSSQNMGLHSNLGQSIHYDAQSLIKLGELFFHKYLKTTKIPITQ